ncbi:glycosyl hydrolase family 65 protein, partial [Streptomyces sp. CHB19.2]
GLRVQPAPPPALPATRLQLRYQGSQLQVSWEPPRLAVRLADPEAAPIRLLTEEGHFELSGTKSWTWQRQ